ncbi:glycosyltransferase [Bacillus gobiensis]|uniref:glycosyltransferase n=1 Tax=Bacillus gobiensis TaxID=1441095 RepID=UPI003D22A092
MQCYEKPLIKRGVNRGSESLYYYSNFNCPYVDQAIVSAINQTYSNIEIIVVDDGSTMFQEKIKPYFEQISYIRKENGGTATALNEGIQRADGEFIAWLSSDDLFLPEKVEKQISFMNNTILSFTNYDYIDENVQVLITWVTPRFSDGKEVYHAVLEGNPINGCSVIMKKYLFDKIGFFNPGFRYTHYYDMWFRILLTGHTIDYLDENLLKFRSHPNSETRNFQPQIQQEIHVIETYYRPVLMGYLKTIQ